MSSLNGIHFTLTGSSKSIKKFIHSMDMCLVFTDYSYAQNKTIKVIMNNYCATLLIRIRLNSETMNDELNTILKNEWEKYTINLLPQLNSCSTYTNITKDYNDYYYYM